MFQNKGFRFMERVASHFPDIIPDGGKELLNIRVSHKLLLAILDCKLQPEFNITDVQENVNTAFEQ